MSKIFDLYTKDQNGNDIARTWYQSSNIKYSECVDNDNALKTLRVVFNNGTQYQYEKVDVKDFLLFREDASQGKALNKYIKAKGYEYKKIEDVNIDDLEKELTFRMEDGLFVYYDGLNFTLKDNKDKILCKKEVKLSEDAFNMICNVLESLGKQLYTDGKNFANE